LAVVALGAAIASPWSFVLLVMAAGVIISWEWGRLVGGSGFDRVAVIEAIGVAALAVLVTLGRPDLALIALAATVAAIGFASIASNTLGWSLAGLAYAALPAWALVWLRSDQSLGAVAVLYLFAVAWTTDTASYAAGHLIGGPKLAPRISPRKTWSGFIVGALAPSLIGYAFAAALGGTSAWRLALVSVALALACQLGDLVESAVKRRFGAKDMSHLIPGHGGLFDRIDGLLLAAILAALIALRDPASPGRALLVW
ncbi:MAG TPA: phosphatidate cytidylyltransferase, partial [Rhizobiales bacterium]|nr:phosphatidate cytidylyltransferase [Hyphomicrobiales bacterium]